MRIRVVALTAVAALSICAPIQLTPAQATQQGSARTEVQKFVKDYIDATNRVDATALSETVSRRSDVSSVKDGTITRGWEANRSGTDELTGKQGSFAFSIGTMDVTMLGSTYALVVAPTSVAARNQQGQVVEVKGAVTIVLEKGRDGWKILTEHDSSRRQ